MRLTSDFGVYNTRKTGVCARVSVAFEHTLPHTLANTQQLNWVIRAIYIIMQASGCFNGIVCGNVLPGTAVRSDRNGKKKTTTLYFFSDVRVKPCSRLNIHHFWTENFYSLIIILHQHTKKCLTG